MRGLLSRRGRGRGRGSAGQPPLIGKSKLSNDVVRSLIFQGGNSCSLPAPIGLTLTPRTPAATRTSTPGLLNFYGFETGSADDEVAGLIYTGSFSGIHSSAARRRGYGLLMDIGSGGNGTFRLGKHNPTTGQAASLRVSELFLTFWFKAVTLPSPGDVLEIAYARDLGGGDKWKIIIDADGNIDVIDAAETALFGSTEKISTGVWRKFEVYSDSSSTGNFRIKMYDNFGLIPNYDSGGVSADTGGDYDYVALGSYTGISADPIEWHYDDVILHGSQFFTDGHYRVAAIKPNATGDVSEWTAGTGASDYTQIDELPAVNTDYIQSGTGAGKKTHLVNLQSRANDSTYGNTIKGVKAFAQIRENASGTSETSIIVKTASGENYTVPVNTGTTDSPQYGFWDKNPATAVDWTAAEIDALQAGVAEYQAIAVRANAIAVFALIRETQTVSMATASLALTKKTPTATKTEHNKSAIPLATITTTPRTPGATTTETSGHTSAIPAESLTTTPRTPAATTTEHNKSAVPVSSRTLTANAPAATKTEHHKFTVAAPEVLLIANTPAATTTEKHKSAIPAASLSTTPRTPTAATTESHKISIPLSARTLTANTPAVTTTEHHKSAVPLSTRTLTANTPTATTTEHNRASIPLVSLTLTERIPGAHVGESSYSAIPTASLSATPRTPGATTTENHKSAVPVSARTLTANVPSAAKTEHHRSAVVLGALAITGRTPAATTTERHKVALPAATLTITAQIPGAATSDNEDYTSTIPLASITVTAKTPGATTTERHYCTVAVGSLTVTSNAPGATTTEHHKSALPASVGALTGLAPAATTTEHHKSAMALAVLSITGLIPGVFVSTAAGAVLKWFYGKDQWTLFRGKSIKVETPFAGKDSDLKRGKNVNKLLSGKDNSDGYF